MTYSSALVISFALSVGTVSAATAQNPQTQVRDMDQNNDGVITRNEWRGNDRAFQARDKNKDGILSGDEVRSVDQRRQEDGDDRESDRLLHG
jgi:Ca2+-binding EF-hand superfamily protein